MDKKEMIKLLSGGKQDKFITKSGDLKKVSNEYDKNKKSTDK